MKSGAPVSKLWILLAAVAATAAGCSPREFKDRAGDIQLWAQRGFAESQADYGDSFPNSGGGGGGVYPRPQVDPAAEKAAAEKAAADAAAAAAPAPKRQYVVIMP
ncbi:hypothetical protein [Phenylobacterium sp.]|uniref:hypothetical protein n=1 Tax=Phenylobacterium sp. TaxID=1871053 RepID=UPI0025F88F70|nr:hypothetical protein [Phenylobacterium sp.]